MFAGALGCARLVTVQFVMDKKMHPRKLEDEIKRMAGEYAPFEKEVGYQVAEHLEASASPRERETKVDISFPYNPDIHDLQGIETAILNLLTRLEGAISNAILQRDLLDILDITE